MMRLHTQSLCVAEKHSTAKFEIVLNLKSPEYQDKLSVLRNSSGLVH